MSEPSTTTRGQRVVDLMFHALKVSNAPLNACAADLLAQLGDESVGRMVREASLPKNGLAYRLRLLGVIERIGWVPTAADWLGLNVLAADKNPKIRAAATRCVVHCPPRGRDRNGANAPSRRTRCPARPESRF